MKVLLVNKFHYRKGGSETYYFTVAEALRVRGHEVIFFSMRDDEKNIPCEQEKYFVSNAATKGSIKSKLNMVMHIAYSREACAKMKALLKDEKPDLVILNLVHKQITLSIIDAIKKFHPMLPIFWTIHDLITVCPSYTMLDGKGEICEKCLQGSFAPCVENRCIKGSRLMSMLAKYEADYIRKKKWYDKVDLFICPSKFYQEKLERAGFTNSKIITLRNPLPLGTVYESNDGDNGYIIYFGRLSIEKGVRVLIDSAKEVGCKLLILGTGPIEDELRAYAGIDSNIEFKGFQTGEALTNYIRGSRCVVLPSQWYENGPYSAMEAMALGKPLIVSDKGGLPELVEDGKNGYIYSDKEGLPGLSDCLQKIFNLTYEEYQSMVRCSLDKARKMFNPEKYIDKIETYYGALE